MRKNVPSLFFLGGVSLHPVPLIKPMPDPTDLSFHNATFEATPNTVNSDISDLIKEMNQDTITSLRNFLESAPPNLPFFGIFN